MTVVAAFKLMIVASGEGAHQAQNRHASFSTGVNKSYHFNAGNGINHFSASTFSNTECTEAGAFPGLREAHR